MRVASLAVLLGRIVNEVHGVHLQSAWWGQLGGLASQPSES